MHASSSAMRVPAEPVFDRFSDAVLPDSDRVACWIDRALIRLRRSMPDFLTGFPAPSSRGGRYDSVPNLEWTSGFWTGQLWLATSLSNDPVFSNAARRQIPTYLTRVRERTVVDHHDLGFLYSPSCCLAFDLEGDEDARDAALLAAELLLARYSPVTQVVQAWGSVTDPAQRGRMIINCNLNLPLLWWAARQTGDARFSDAAARHVAQAARHLIRPDYSTIQTFYIDTETGLPRYGSTHQGFSDDSCWARGQAWGIYGFAIAFRHTGDAAYLALASQLADYFLARLPDDAICAWDLVFTGETDLRDSSAAAIAASGLLDLAASLPATDRRRGRYEAAAAVILESLDAGYLTDLEASNGLLTHGVHHLPNGIGVDECCIWGDYFYLEALTRLKMAWRSCW